MGAVGRPDYQGKIYVAESGEESHGFHRKPETETMKGFCLLMVAVLMPVEAFSWSGCATNAFVNEVRRFEEIGNTANFILSKKNYSLHKLKKLLSPVIRISNEKTEYVNSYNPIVQSPSYSAYFSERGFTSTAYKPHGIPYSKNFRGISLEFDVTNNMRFITFTSVKIGISFITEPDFSSVFVLKDKLYPGRKMHIRWFAKTSRSDIKSLSPVIYAVSVIPGNIEDSLEPYDRGIDEYDSQYCR